MGVAVGVGWYRENQWALLLEHAEDKEELFPTYAGWLKYAHKNTKTMEESGYPTRLDCRMSEGGYAALTSPSNSGCRSSTLSSFTRAKGGLVFPVS